MTREIDTAMPPRLLVSPDSFKGTLTSAEVAAAIAAGARAGGAEADECPVADGGEGTVDVLAAALGAEPRTTVCHDPLGRDVEAGWAWLARSRTALLEMASASGLALLDPAEREAEAASSAGTGELLLAARDAGAERAILAIGGTATSDGGVGAVAALERAGGPGAMRIVLACDVRIPFEAAAEIFGPQKGASPDAVVRLTARLNELAGELPRDPRGREMTGAGGGIAGALWALYGAEPRRGAALVLDAVGFARRLAAADAVVVGEGHLDAQTREGKIVAEILARAGAKPVHAVVGGRDAAAEHGGWGDLASVRLAGTAGALRAAGAEIAALVAAEARGKALPPGHSSSTL